VCILLVTDLTNHILSFLNMFHVFRFMVTVTQAVVARKIILVRALCLTLWALKLHLYLSSWDLFNDGINYLKLENLLFNMKVSYHCMICGIKRGFLRLLII
jgi:hypothetical protein